MSNKTMRDRIKSNYVLTDIIREKADVLTDIIREKADAVTYIIRRDQIGRR